MRFSRSQHAAGTNSRLLPCPRNNFQRLGRDHIFLALAVGGTWVRGRSVSSGCAQDVPQHFRIGHSRIGSHFGKVAVPAPARVGIYFQNFRITFRVQAPVKTNIVPAFQPFAKDNTPLDDSVFGLIRELGRYRFQAPIRRLGAPLGLITANVRQGRRQGRIIFFGHRKHCIRGGRVAD